MQPARPTVDWQHAPSWILKRNLSLTGCVEQRGWRGNRWHTGWQRKCAWLRFISIHPQVSHLWMVSALRLPTKYHQALPRDCHTWPRRCWNLHPKRALSTGMHIYTYTNATYVSCLFRLLDTRSFQLLDAQPVGRTELVGTGPWRESSYPISSLLVALFTPAAEGVRSEC